MYISPVIHENLMKITIKNKCIFGGGKNKIKFLALPLIILYSPKKKRRIYIYIYIYLILVWYHPLIKNISHDKRVHR